MSISSFFRFHIHSYIHTNTIYFCFLLQDIKGECQLTEEKRTSLKHLKRDFGPTWLAQLDRALSQYAKVMGSIPGHNTYMNQIVNV